LGAPVKVGSGEGLGSCVGVGGLNVGVAVAGSGVGIRVAASKGVEVKYREKSSVGVAYSPHNPFEHPDKRMAAMQSSGKVFLYFMVMSKELYL
jgi:hypothetical protein